MTEENDLLDRVAVRSDVFVGKPIIRDMRSAAARERMMSMMPRQRLGIPPTAPTSGYHRAGGLGESCRAGGPEKETA